MKRLYIITAITCAIVFACFFGWFRLLNFAGEKEHVKIGFIYDNDESTPYTYNFSIAKDAVEKKYGKKAEIFTCSNVLDDEMEEPLRELAQKGCDVIFFNGYSTLVRKLAPEYPATEFCQTSYQDMNGQKVPENYHTFKGEAYQGRYVSGIAAGMKIKQMIEEGVITKQQASIGFVAAFPTSEVISGYTAFLLGARSVVPQVTMRVCYTKTWSSYAQEKNAAQKLIKEGCVIISQHTDTIGPAIACEEASENTAVYFVGYNQSMSEVAPGTSLVTSRICWEHYVLSAVEAVVKNKDIEKVVKGEVHGSDVSAGFEQGWVEMVDLNKQTAAPDTQKAMDVAIEKFRRGETAFAFRCNLIGVNPNDPSDTIDLKNGYKENEKTSYPLFHYILKDIIYVE
ncbi:MAG: BMP family ABC transporter substrate-binding protein [Lachnospiraceae bacterium]|jgi:basic membrane protein A|nr:BMP family ABC transporter substrate-binding protein [Lachnospiraceae bacterium]